jgi:hypothetical protein
MRAQQAQNRARNEQTPLKERIDRSDAAIESPDSSSAADDIAIEGQDSSSAIAKGNEGLPRDEKSNQSLPLKPLSSRKPETNWADEISERSEEDVNMDNQSDRNSSAIRADYAAIRAEINPGFSVVNPEEAIVRVYSSSTNNVGACHISVANLFLSQSKENSPSASPLRDRKVKSSVEDIDPKEIPADPRFVLSQDILDAIDVSQETEEETMPESLLHGHFKVLYEREELNTVEQVKAAYMRVLQTEDCNVSEDFLYDITLQLYQSADPFGTAAHNFTIA